MSNRFYDLPRELRHKIELYNRADELRFAWGGDVSHSFFDGTNTRRVNVDEWWFTRLFVPSVASKHRHWLFRGASALGVPNYLCTLEPPREPRRARMYRWIPLGSSSTLDALDFPGSWPVRNGHWDELPFLLQDELVCGALVDRRLGRRAFDDRVKRNFPRYH